MVARYEDHEPIMDARVEDYLGDSIIYTRQGGAPQIVRGFINNYSDEGGADGFDPLRRRWTVKINMLRLPDGPKPTDRITHKKLNMVAYRPSTGTIADDGRDYSFAIQKAPA